jgi:hypothetical protein
MNLRLVALVFVLLFCAVSRATEPAKVTIEDYDKVVIGSRIQFVYECLGKQTSISFYGGCQKSLKWEGEGFTIVIRFKNNRVVEKWQSGLGDTD